MKRNRSNTPVRDQRESKIENRPPSNLKRSFSQSSAKSMQSSHSLDKQSGIKTPLGKGELNNLTPLTNKNLIGKNNKKIKLFNKNKKIRKYLDK